MSEVSERKLFKKYKKLSVKVDGFDVWFNIVELYSGGFKAYMLVMSLDYANGDEHFLHGRRAGILANRYEIKTKVDPRDVEGLKELDLERSAVELVRERLAGYMPCIRKHRKALVDCLDATQELRKQGTKCNNIFCEELREQGIEYDDMFYEALYTV